MIDVISSNMTQFWDVNLTEYGGSVIKDTLPASRQKLPLNKSLKLN